MSILSQLGDTWIVIAVIAMIVTVALVANQISELRDDLDEARAKNRDLVVENERLRVLLRQRRGHAAVITGRVVSR